MKIKLKKYEQALALLPDCKALDKSVLYDHLKFLGYRWDGKRNNWQLR